MKIRERTGLVFHRTHIFCTVTHAMEHFPGVFPPIEPTVPPMVCCPLLQYRFHPAIPLDCASLQTNLVASYAGMI